MKDDYKSKPVPLIINLYRSFKKKDNKIIIKGCGFTKLTRSKEILDLSKVKLDITGEDDVPYQVDINFRYAKGLPFVKGYRFNLYKIVLDLNRVLKLDIQNKLIVNYKDKYFGSFSSIFLSVFNFLNGCLNTLCSIS